MLLSFIKLVVLLVLVHYNYNNDKIYKINRSKLYLHVLQDNAISNCWGTFTIAPPKLVQFLTLIENNQSFR